MRVNMHSKPEGLSNEDVFSNKVQQLLEVTKVNLALGQLASAIMQQSKQSITENSKKADTAALNQTLNFFEQEFQKELPGLSSTIVELYKSVFTLREVEEVLGFYGSPAGQKFLQGGTQVEQQLPLAAQQWGSTAGQAAFERAKARAEAIS